MAGMKMMEVTAYIQLKLEVKTMDVGILNKKIRKYYIWDSNKYIFLIFLTIKIFVPF